MNLALLAILQKVFLFAAIVIGIFTAGWYFGAKGMHDQWNAAKAAETASINEAILKRVAENAKQAETQSAINAAITKAKNEDLAPVVAAISADRLRIGPVLCSGRSTAPTQAESAGSSNAADPASGLVSQQSERDFRALKIRVEDALATGRACQAFVTENGMAP